MEHITEARWPWAMRLLLALCPPCPGWCAALPVDLAPKRSSGGRGAASEGSAGRD